MLLIKRLLSKLLNATVVPLLALLLIFEEWGWEPLSRLMAQLSRLPLWARLEAWIVRLPSYAALLVFVVPMVLLFPLKLLALYWISKGHALLGLAVVLAAKVAGTAGMAWLFALTQPALMKLAWFARLYGRWKPWKDGLIARVKSSQAWHTTSALGQAVRAAGKRLLQQAKHWFR